MHCDRYDAVKTITINGCLKTGNIFNESAIIFVFFIADRGS